MSTQTLRALAKGYAIGSIDKEKYRKSRAELIEGIIEGNVVLKTIDYDPPLKPNNDIEDAITEGISRDKTEIISPQKKSKPAANNVPPTIKQNVNKKKPPYIFILLSTIIVLSLILAVILFYPKPPESNSVVAVTSDNSNISSSSINKTNISSAGETLIADFLRGKNWNEDSLDMFTESWSALSDQERVSAKNTKRMQRMIDSIYKQFLEGKALASIDSQKAINKQQKLIDFANAIGIKDPRLILE